MKRKNMNDEICKGDMVRRMIKSHYTNDKLSDAIGIVLRVSNHLARVYFYDTNQEEVWNRKVLKKVESARIGR
jgi:hypothetical protein